MGKNVKPPETPDLPTEDDFASAREASPVQWSRGTRQIPLQWLDDALDNRSQQSKSQTSSKK